MSDRITGPFQRPETSAERLRSWWGYLPVTRAEFHEHMASLWHFVTDEVTSTVNALNDIRGEIMATAEEFATRLDAATNEVASDLAGVRAELENLRGQVDGAAAAAVDAALAQLDAPIARLEALGQDPQNPVPDPEPAPEDPNA